MKSFSNRSGAYGQVVLAALLALGTSAPSARAHNPKETGGLDEMAKRAELIFLGSVEKVEYAFSTPAAKDEQAVPHTFVTYRIDEVLKGASPGKSLTLRWTGGRGKDADFLMVANYPLFDAKDRDILFVQGNAFRACPLVGCAQGRFRSIEGRIYGERGNEARLTKEGALYRGPQRDLEPVRTHKVSQTIISRVSVEEEGEAKLDDDSKASFPGEHVSEKDFVAHLRDVVARTHSKEELAKLRPVLSADPAKPFSFKVPPQLGPPDTKRPAAKVPSGSERAEQASLEEGEDALAGKTASR